MKFEINIVELILAFLLSAAISLAFAKNSDGHARQSEAGAIHSLLTNTTGRPIQASAVTDNRRSALWNCMVATERISRVALSMEQTGTRWNRSRLSYDENDLIALGKYNAEIDAYLGDLTVAQQAFRTALSEAQQRSVKPQLSKLNHLEAKLSSQVQQLRRDIRKARPGPNAPDISWDISAIKNSASRWRSEDRKIADKIQIPICGRIN